MTITKQRAKPKYKKREMNPETNPRHPTDRKKPRHHRSSRPSCHVLHPPSPPPPLFPSRFWGKETPPLGPSLQDDGVRSRKSPNESRVPLVANHGRRERKIRNGPRREATPPETVRARKVHVYQRFPPPLVKAKRVSTPQHNLPHSRGMRIQKVGCGTPSREPEIVVGP